jgi:hypothetical protein
MYFSGDKYSNLCLLSTGELPIRMAVDRILDSYNFEKNLPEMVKHHFRELHRMVKHHSREVLIICITPPGNGEAPF